MIKAFGWGRLTADIELQDVGDTRVADFSLAVNEFVGKDENKKSLVHYFDCEVWDTAADYLAKNAKKGDMIVFHGIPRQERWETKEGDKRQKIVFRITNFEINPKKTPTDE